MLLMCNVIRTMRFVLSMEDFQTEPRMHSIVTNKLIFVFYEYYSDVISDVYDGFFFNWKV